MFRGAWYRRDCTELVDHFCLGKRACGEGRRETRLDESIKPSSVLRVWFVKRRECKSAGVLRCPEFS